MSAATSNTPLERVKFFAYLFASAAAAIITTGCAVVAVTGAVVGTAASVASSAVSTAADVAGTAVKTTAKVIGKGVDAATGD